MLEPELLLTAYRRGIFPMAVNARPLRELVPHLRRSTKGIAAGARTE